MVVHIIKLIKKKINFFRRRSKSFFWKLYLKLSGVKLLSRSASFELLSRFKQKSYTRQAEAILLENFPFPVSVQLNNNEKQVKVLFEKDYVWNISRNEQIKSIHICRYGSVLINKKFLLWIGSRWPRESRELGSIKRKSTLYKHDLLIAPVSQVWWGNFSYYDFIFYVLAKLCRVEEELGFKTWEGKKVCYPLLKTNFESEFLQKLGIRESDLINTLDTNTKIEAETLILLNSQVSTFETNQADILLNPKFFPSPNEIFLLRSRFLPQKHFSTKIADGRRLYLTRSRKRRVENESEVLHLLKRFNFEVVEDVQRSIDEQISLFNEASVIVGPHGSGFTNLLWCKPGTKVIEFFNGRYIAPHYYYICQVLNLDYRYIFEKTDFLEYNVRYMYSNITVNTEVLKNYLKAELS